MFRAQAALLDTHRGYDAGALAVAKELAMATRATLVTSTVSRLLVDLNRSLGNPRVFSAASRAAPSVVRRKIVQQYYLPYRERVEWLVARAVSRGRRVIHISSHSFTPRLYGKVRRADVGLLYHPGRAGEVALAAQWKSTLEEAAPELRVRRNYPYAGKGDGLMSHLRQRFPSAAYVGIELEVNQKFVLAAGPRWKRLRGVLTEALLAAHAGDRVLLNTGDQK